MKCTSCLHDLRKNPEFQPSKVKGALWAVASAIAGIAALALLAGSVVNTALGLAACAVGGIPGGVITLVMAGVSLVAAGMIIYLAVQFGKNAHSHLQPFRVKKELVCVPGAS